MASLRTWDTLKINVYFIVLYFFCKLEYKEWETKDGIKSGITYHIPQFSFRTVLLFVTTVLGCVGLKILILRQVMLSSGETVMSQWVLRSVSHMAT